MFEFIQESSQSTKLIPIVHNSSSATEQVVRSMKERLSDGKSNEEVRRSSSSLSRLTVSGDRFAAENAD